MSPRPPKTGRRPLAAGLALIIAALSPSARAWGDLGHRTVAETAALLVEQDHPDSWGPIFARHRFQLGYYAFLPDALYRRIDGAEGRVEGPTHFLDLDVAAGSATLSPDVLRTLESFPRRFSDARARLESKSGRKRTRRGGSLPWRVEQFLRLARGQLGAVTAVAGGYQSGSTSREGALRVYLALQYLGVMSHYSGDAAVPHHATSDWNGYAEGQGGIHYYFESDCVGAFEPELADDVLDSAVRNRSRWLAAWKVDREPPAGVVIRLLVDSAEALPKLLDLDRRKAVIRLAEAGSEASATRRPPRTGCRAMRTMLVERLAKGAVATAYLWETVLPDGVDFSAASDLQFSDFELEPDYVPPAYDTADDGR